LDGLDPSLLFDNPVFGSKLWYPVYFENAGSFQKGLPERETAQGIEVEIPQEAPEALTRN
jgi:hypothetical protein